MRKLFIADDGTEFEDEYECEEYEFINEFKDNNLVMFSSNKSRITSIEDFNNCNFIIIKSQADLDKLIKYCDSYGCRYGYPKEIGCYYYDYDSDQWDLIDSKIEQLILGLNEYYHIKELLTKVE